MTVSMQIRKWTYPERLDALRESKMRHTREKQRVIGAMDHDDWGIILPAPEDREVVQAVNGSGVTTTDVRFKGVEIESNHASGSFYGARACGRNFRSFLEALPTYVDPLCSLAGASRGSFLSYQKVRWNPDYETSHLHEEQEKYQLVTGIGAVQHFCEDLSIGLQLGWGGLLAKVRRYREVHAPKAAGFYDGLEDVVLGAQDWIRRTVETARQMAEQETHPQLRSNLEQIVEINERLVTEPPRTFREACQWILWYRMVARMYNGGGSLGQLDVLLAPFYERDVAAGLLTDEEAVFYLACYLLRQTSYIQVGGPDEQGADVTHPVSYLILEAAHRLRIPSNVGVCVGDRVDPGLLRRGVEILFEDKAGSPKFVGIENAAQGFCRNGYPIELARKRIYSGCHWFAIPGREYTLNDTVKVNLAVILEVALGEMFENPDLSPSVETLWERYETHLRRAVEVIAEGIDFHVEHMHRVMPELPKDLCCYGPLEKGLDASHGGVEYYNMCVDGAGLATVADSFATLEQRVEREQRLTWEQMRRYLESNWAGADGERARLMMKGIPRYGSGGSPADEWAVRVSQCFARTVKAKPTPGGLTMIPGLFSWAKTIAMGKHLGATPNGRYAGDPISHGANPDPGFSRDGAPTALAVAVGKVQPGYGNAAPVQMDLNPGLGLDDGGVDKIASLIKAHVDMGGTEVNINVLDAEKVLEAHRDPTKYPDLVVRVTGFSAYFGSLSPAFRQLVVDRIIAEP